MLVNGDDVVRFVPAEGRKRFAVHTYKENGHTYVVPQDAAPLLRDGKLDRRLFDVTTLAAFGYDDAKRDTTPLIVKQTNSVLRSTSNVLGFATVRAKKTGNDWETIKSGAVERVWLDGVRKPSLDHSTGQIGAPAAWQAGVTGKGVKVAVLDTGVDQSHPDLVGREIAEKNFTEAPDTNDTVGHGTHVAATIAGNGAKYKGVAPDAHLLDGKVCSDAGCPESAILAGVHWAVEQGADIVNMSLGGEDQPGIDPMEETVNRLSQEKGVLFVVAAGNSGDEPRTIDSPGSAEMALTVGAVDRADGIAPFSSRGPTSGDGSIKPDITAPGVDIVAARSKHAGSLGSEDHVAMTGTSMATPHVAGAAALLKQQHPLWKRAQLKATLMASAKPTAGATPWDQGAGRVDVARALDQRLVVEPASLDLGVQEWPHQDDPKIVRELTYRNSGPEPVTLDMSVDVRNAPAGMFTVSPAKLVVPAGSEAKATVTADTTVEAPDGTYIGAVLAGAMRTSISVTREVESYEVTFKHIDDTGAPTAKHDTLVTPYNDPSRTYRPRADSGTARQRLPKGEYFATSAFQPAAGKQSLLSYPKLIVAGPLEIVLDARVAKPVSVKAPEPGATPGHSEVGFTFTRGDWRFPYIHSFPDGFGDRVSIGHTGPTDPEFRSSIESHFAGRAKNPATPVGYRLAWFQKGRTPTGFVRAVKRQELAEMRTVFTPGPAGRKYQLSADMVSPEGRRSTAVATPIPLGGTAIDHVLADGPRWSFGFFQQDENGNNEISTASAPKTLKAGRTYRQRLNTAVHGPGLDQEVRGPALVRMGKEIGINVPLFGDGIAGSTGFARVTSARTVLTRDGKTVGESPDPANGLFSVPDEDGEYRLETSAARDVSELTTKVEAAWTFRSSYVDGTRQLPLTVVRFQPKLSESDSARTGLLRVPLVVQQQKGTAHVVKIEVESSFDDGATWRKVPVAGTNAMVTNDRSGFASLRARTVDAIGNTSEITLIRAYRVAG
ncbi:S8 family serine peptidase [Lentzea albidocapillata]|uniref:S8 family serine peptidase n=1 Tax=Lentzea albidocapillata TaxID=40571 RepID=UPI0015A485A0|nr:S8 family serine peptidase [Lentzea albidocapillata]